MRISIINPRNQRGIALLSAILLGFIIFGFVVAWLTILYTRNKMASLEQQKMQAKYIAESGLAKLQWYLSDKNEKKINFTEPQTWKENLFINGGKCKFSTAFEYGYIKAISIGIANKGSAEISAYIGIEPDSLFPEALIIGDPRGLKLGSGASIIGDIRMSTTSTGPVGPGYKIIQDPFPVINNSSYEQAILYFMDILQNPHRADQELFSPLVIDNGKNAPPQDKIYVNDNIIIVGRSEEQPIIISSHKVFMSTGDIQISGWANLEGCTVAAIGKVSILDEAIVTNAEIFSTQEVVIADNARVEGKIFTQNNIIVMDQAKVTGNSIVYSSGNPSGKIFLGNSSSVSGCAILCGNPGLEGGLFIMDDAAIRGLAYSANRICIQGNVYGIAAGSRLYNPNMDSLSNNYVLGTIKRPGMTGNLLLPVAFKDSLPRGWMKIVR